MTRGVAWRCAYESMGTGWEVAVWDQIKPGVWEKIQREIKEQSAEFEQTYSRFIRDSLVWRIAARAGVYEVPRDLVKMLELYRDLNAWSQGKINPLIGFTISDLGYDAEYTLEPKETIRRTPNFEEGLRILDETHIETREPVLIDLGALGKGFFVDRLAAYLRRRDIKRFLIDGSGDIYYQGEESIRAGLEHPTDKTLVIGVVEMTTGALAASGVDRRRWNKYHHVIDPEVATSPEKIIATWVRAATAALADGLATALFMRQPEDFTGQCQFEYCLVNKEKQVRQSKGFRAILF